MSDLRRHAVVAVGSSWLLSFAGDGIRLVTMMILARLLLPEDYGHFALATAITGWLTGFGFLNFAPQLLRERGEPGEVATYLLFGLALQTVLALIGLAVAAALWFVWEQRLVAALVAVAVLALPLQVPAQIEAQLLQRDFRWRAVRLWQLFTMLAGSAVSILLAWQGFGPFALLAGVLVEPVPLAMLLVSTRSIRPLVAKPEISSRMRAFGWPMVAGSLSWKTRELVSSWAVGLALGAAELGLLGRATGLAGLVLERFSAQTSYALLPVLVKACEDPGRRLKAGTLLLRAAAWSTIPVAVLLVLTGPTAVRILYGPQWMDIVPLLPFSAALGVAHAHLSAVMPLMLASGRTRERLICDLLLLAGMAVAVPALLGGARVWLGALCLATLLPTAYLLRHVVREGWLDGEALRQALVPPIVATMAGLVCATPLRMVADGIAVDMGAAVVFTATFTLTVRWLAPAALFELLDCVPGGMRIATFIAVANSVSAR